MLGDSYDEDEDDGDGERLRLGRGRARAASEGSAMRLGEDARAECVTAMLGAYAIVCSVDEEQGSSIRSEGDTSSSVSEPATAMKGEGEGRQGRPVQGVSQ